MEYPIFDTHAHYSARAFDADRFALLDSLPGKGVVGVCEQGGTPRPVKKQRAMKGGDLIHYRLKISDCFRFRHNPQRE